MMVAKTISKMRGLKPMLTLMLALCCFLHPCKEVWGNNDRDNTVRGVVSDSEGPLPGVSVIIKGTKTGVVSGADGVYSIDVSSHKNPILEFSFIGFKTQSIPVAPGMKLDVKLELDSHQLEDVVVIGYGEVGEHDITGTVARVSSKELLKSPAIGVDAALQGRVAGLSVNSADGQPGVDNEIVIRGANSLTQDNSPLYVIDGFPHEDFSLSTLNSTDIKSFTVLKDASATAIYGSRGANGVIVIETTQGEVGKPKVEYNGMVGFQQVTKKMEMMNAYEYVKYMLERNSSYEDRFLTGEGMTLEDYRNVESHDWQDELFRLAPIHKHNITISGGTSQTRYKASFTYTGQDGVISNSGYDRYQGSISLHQALHKNLKMRLNLTYFEDDKYGQTASRSLDSTTGYQTYLMYRTWAFRPVTLKNYRPNADLDETDDEYNDMYDGNTLNPIISNSNEDKHERRKSLVGNVRFDWTIIKGLKFQTQAGIKRLSTETENFYNSLTYNGRPKSGNSFGVNADYAMSQLNEWINENTLTYNNRSGYHVYDALIGFTMEGKTQKSYGYKTIQIPNEDMGITVMDDGTLYSSTATSTSSRLMSYLARFNYSYKNRYLFTVSFRADGSSKFAAGNRWGYFPSGAFAWNVSDEPWLKHVGWMENLKLRVSWGLTGNNRVNNNARYAYLTANDWLSFGNGTPQQAYELYSIGNRNLKWETTEQYNVGVDFSVLRDRISLVVDLYRKTTRDLLLNSNVTQTAGVSKLYRNIGCVRNEGLEISLNTINIQKRHFVWKSDFNISFNRSRVMSLTNDENQMLTSVNWTGNFKSTPLYITQVGGPLTAFYGFVYDGLYQVEDFYQASDGSYTLKEGIPTNGTSDIQPGHIRFKDVTGDGEITDADRVIMGRAEPIHTGGFNNSFRCRNFELSVLLQWSYGAKVMNANRIMFEGNQSNRSINQFASYADRYIAGDPSTYDSDNFATGGAGPLGWYSSKTLEDGSYLRLKTVQLSYNLPKKVLKKIRIQNLQVYVSGNNLATLTGYSGLDPEVSTYNSALTPGFDYSAYARNRIYSFGINITF